MINLAGTPRILKRRKVLDQLLNRHRRPPFVDEGRTETPRYTVKSHQPISCVAPGGQPPFGPPEVAAMSRTVSPSSGRPYGLARVCRVWRASRASVYRHLSSSRRELP